MFPEADDFCKVRHRPLSPTLPFVAGIVRQNLSVFMHLGSSVCSARYSGQVSDFPSLVRNVGNSSFVCGLSQVV